MSANLWPSSSQSIPENLSNIFTYANGASVPVFVDAGGVTNSPKLLRTIRSGGAEIVHFPSLAKVILIDPTVDSGRQFIRDWSADADKVVLDLSWVKKCVDAGRALLMNDEWGGSLAIDDGEPIKGDGESEDGGVHSSTPLPISGSTPTARESSPQHHKPAKRQGPTQNFQNQAHPHVTGTSAAASSSTLSPMPLRDPSIYSGGNDNNGYTNNTSDSPRRDSFHNLTSYDFPHFPSTQPQPQLQPQQNHFPSSMVTHTYQGQHAPLLNPAQMSMGMSQGDINALNMNMNANSLGMSTGMGLNMGPMNVNPLNYGSMNTVQPNALNNPNLVATLMDVMRYQNNIQGWSQGQQGVPAPMLQNGFTTQNQLNGDQHIFQEFAGSTPSQMNSSVASVPAHVSSTPPSSQTQRSLEPPSSQVPSPSIPRRRSRSRSSGSDKRPSSVKRETRSAKRARHRPVSQPSRRHRRRHSPTPSIESDDTTPDSIQISPVGTPPPRTQPPPTGSPRKAGEIFRSESGSPLSFFVQVDLKKRLEVIQKIKKNGGTITGDHLQADYAILFSRSQAFKDLFIGLKSAGMPALTPVFVDDCVDAGALLQIDERRGHVITANIGLNMGGRKTNQASRGGRAVAARSSAANNNVAQERSAGPSSPPAPSLNPRMRLADGRWLFSPEEKTFVLDYARTLIQFDQSVSNNYIATKIYRKLPHHTFASWYSYIQTKCKDDFDDIRKRVGIANRKADDMKIDRENQTVEMPNNTSPPTTQHLGGNDHPRREGHGRPANPMRPQNPSKNTVQPRSKEEQEDIDTICSFFADGGGEESDDELVWANLTNSKTCKTNSDWSEFYRGHEVEINEKIKDLMRVAGGRVDDDEMAVSDMVRPQQA